jgi:hypothetical protein
MAALKNLRLNITRAKLGKEADPLMPVNHVFYITDAQTSEKVLKSSKVEEIRATILANLVQYHEEAKERLAWAVTTERATNSDLLSPLGAPPRYGWSVLRSGRCARRRVTKLDRRYLNKVNMVSTSADGREVSCHDCACGLQATI